MNEKLNKIKHFKDYLGSDPIKESIQLHPKLFNIIATRLGVTEDGLRKKACEAPLNDIKLVLKQLNLKPWSISVEIHKHYRLEDFK